MGVRRSSRRSFIKLAAAAPLLTQIAARNLYAQAATAIGKDPRQNVYTRLGVKTVINCRGTWTYLSGSLEFPEVRQAQVEAAQHFVNMLELQRGVGRRLAELTGAESGMITSGAAGAMAAATAACMAGTDDKHVWQLPDTTGLKHEVIMVGGRSAFDSAIRLTGAKLVLVFSPEELANAINENTAMIYTTDLGEKLQRELAVAKDRKVPMLLDDAAGIPPADNAKLYARMKIDLYCFSGGKGLCGPQCSGLLLGRKDLIEAALMNSAPREGSVCRPMKVGKEEIIGCLTALETWLNLDEKKIYSEWNGRVDRIRKLVDTVPGVKTDIYIPDDGNRFPTLKVSWDQAAWGFTTSDCVRKLRENDPVIEVLGSDNPSLVTAVREGNPNPKERKEADHIELVSMTIQPGQEIIVGQRLREILSAAQKGKSAGAESARRAWWKTRMRILLVGLLLLSTLEPQAQVRAVVPVASLRSARIVSSSPAVDAGDYVYVSGQGPRRPDGSLPATFAAQVRQALDNVKSVVEAAGLTMDHVVYTQVYLEDISKYGEMNRVFAEVFGKTKTPPARAVLGVAKLPEPSIQINAVAVRNLAERRAVYPPGYKSGRSRVSPGILTHDRLFVSSMSGSDPASGKVPDDPAAQVDLRARPHEGGRRSRGPRSPQHGFRQSLSDCGYSDAGHEPALCAALRIRQHPGPGDDRSIEPARWRPHRVHRRGRA